MQIDVLPDSDAVAREAAKFIAAEARAAVLARGRFLFAVSGGHTPWLMLRALANEPAPVTAQPSRPPPWHRGRSVPASAPRRR